MELGIMRQIADDWPETACCRTFTQANPAAGADFTITVPGESMWGVFSISALFTASAVVANRLPVLRVNDGVATLFRVGVGAAITATQAVTVSWLPELGYRDTATNANTQTIGLPPLYLTAGQQVAVTTTAIDAGDQWSAITMYALEVFRGHKEAEEMIVDRIKDRVEAIVGMATKKL